MNDKKSSAATNYSLHTTHSESGFTLVEVLIVIVLSTALVSLGLRVGIDIYRSNNLSADRDTLVSVLEKARNRAVTNLGESDHGILVANTAYTLFRGSAYATRDQQYDEEIVSSGGITATGTLEYVFERVSGDGIMTGTTTLTNDKGTTLTVSVNSEGGIDW